VQTWHFSDRTLVSIGRADGNDIRLTDTQVSRNHVELIFEDCQWLLRSLGRNGTKVEGQMVSSVRLKDRVVIQLGSNGPSFQFVTGGETDSNTATIDNIDPNALEFLMIDEQRQAEQVEQIADTDVFRSLQQQARRLKEGDAGNDVGGS
jgi:pSer/pThr/pTyr-binding forkhead associated (FHA) protein